jgi:hypothetical protein
MCIMVMGLGFAAVITAAIAQYFIGRKTSDTQLESRFRSSSSPSHGSHRQSVSLDHGRDLAPIL